CEEDHGPPAASPGTEPGQQATNLLAPPSAVAPQASTRENVGMPGPEVPQGPESSTAVSPGTGMIASSASIPPATRQRVRDAFSGFIGNEPAVARLTNDLLRALIETPPHLSKNYLFTGLPSTGKTELSRRIAAALGLPFVKLDGRGVVTRERLFE